MATVHFTLGQNLGIQLAEIAKEHVLDYNIKKANSVWVDSFGCSEDIAEKLTAGEYVVVVDDPEKCLVNVVERSDLSKKKEKEYPKITKEEIYRLIDRNFQSMRDEDNEWVFYDFRGEISKVNRLLAINQPLDIDAHIAGEFCKIFPVWFPKGVEIYGTLTIRPRVLLKELMVNKNEEFQENFENFIEDVCDCDSWRFSDTKKLYNIMWVIRRMLNIKDKADKLIELDDFAIKHLGGDIHHKYATERRVNEVNEWLDDWKHLIKDENLTLEGVHVFDDIADAAIYELPENNTDSSKKSSKKKKEKKFGPTEINKQFNGGWITPDGCFFGININDNNSFIINDLISRTAHDIMNYYGMKVPDNFDFESFAYLAQIGYVKVIYDHIVFEGYDSIVSENELKPTKQQIDMIYEYGKTNYNGVLCFGYDKKQINVEDLKNMNDNQIKELFEL